MTSLALLNVLCHEIFHTNVLSIVEFISQTNCIVLSWTWIPLDKLWQVFKI